jgi:hypothetical protein
MGPRGQGLRGPETVQRRCDLQRRLQNARGSAALAEAGALPDPHPTPCAPGSHQGAPSEGAGTGPSRRKDGSQKRSYGRRIV